MLIIVSQADQCYERKRCRQASNEVRVTMAVILANALISKACTS